MTTSLEAHFRAAGLNPQDLLDDFAQWKAGGPDDHYDFGKDALGFGTKHLFHVHMVPLNDPVALQDWDDAWVVYKRRTSDRYLFYAHGGSREGFLLIAAIADPGAHAIWQNRAILRSFDAVAEDFCVFGKVP